MSDGIKGDSGIVFTLQDGIAAAVPYDMDVKSVKLTSEDKDDADLTFAEAAAGAVKDYQVAITAIQSTETGSLWRLLWDNPGKEFQVVYGPHGNAVPSADKPHFTLSAKATGTPEVGGEAARKGNRYPFDYSMDVTSSIVLDDGA